MSDRKIGMMNRDVQMRRVDVFLAASTEAGAGPEGKKKWLKRHVKYRQRWEKSGWVHKTGLAEPNLRSLEAVTTKETARAACRSYNKGSTVARGDHPERAQQMQARSRILVGAYRSTWPPPPAPAQPVITGPDPDPNPLTTHTSTPTTSADSGPIPTKAPLGDVTPGPHPPPLPPSSAPLPWSPSPPSYPPSSPPTYPPTLLPHLTHKSDDSLWRWPGSALSEVTLTSELRMRGFYEELQVTAPPSHVTHLAPLTLPGDYLYVKVHMRKCWELNTPNNGGTNRINTNPHQCHPRRRTILPYDDPHAPRRNDSDPCLRQFDGVQLTHINGTKRMYSIPLHTLFTDTIWKRSGSRWEHDNKYVCDGPIGGKPEWREGASWGCSLTGCRNVGHILWDTRDEGAGIGIAGTCNRATRAFTNPRTRWDDTRLLQEGGGLSMEGKNVILTLTSVGAHQYYNPLCPSAPNVLYLTVGVSMWGAWDPMSVVRVDILPESTSSTSAVTYSEQGVTIFNVESANDIPTHDIFTQATGFSETNQWLAWLVGTVRLQGLSDCVACAAARPALTTIPVYLNETDDPRGTYCMIRLFIEAHPKNCTLLGNLFPPGLNKTTPPTFKVLPAPYWCFTRVSTRPVGDLPTAWCQHTYNVT
ncbi:hypothetical protein N1851_033175 [Merluccius polli]|uniref:Uncharacterized protein n=1 Tax=Merluccius polli TaxID=89951 RepID=A0AA47M1Q8_MERPO|nr:hypothetical protein N1851_033175 [Merluccius polli]